MKRHIETYTLPAYWASALINNDWSGLKEQEQNDLHYWLADNGCPDFVSCSEESFINRFNGLITDCLEYQAFA